MAFIHDECDKQQPAAAAYNYFDCRQRKEAEFVGTTNNAFHKMKQKSNRSRQTENTDGNPNTNANIHNGNSRNVPKLTKIEDLKISF